MTEQKKTYTCPECLRKFSYKATIAGRVVNCPACKKPIKLPQSKPPISERASSDKPPLPNSSPVVGSNKSKSAKIAILVVVAILGSGILGCSAFALFFFMTTAPSDTSKSTIDRAQKTATTLSQNPRCTIEVTELKSIISCDIVFENEGDLPPFDELRSAIREEMDQLISKYGKSKSILCTVWVGDSTLAVHKNNSAWDVSLTFEPGIGIETMSERDERDGVTYQQFQREGYYVQIERRQTAKMRNESRKPLCYVEIVFETKPVDDDLVYGPLVTELSLMLNESRRTTASALIGDKTKPRTWQHMINAETKRGYFVQFDPDKNQIRIQNKAISKSEMDEMIRRYDDKKKGG